MNTVVYLSYGKGPHEQEVIFSLLSAWRWAAPGRTDVQFVIYTDHPETFAGLPVTIEYVSPETWIEWSGPSQYNHRRKIKVLQHALACFGTKTILLDGDTWWRRSPTSLFDRIIPGHSLMHLREGVIGSLRSPTAQHLATLLQNTCFKAADGCLLRISPSSVMWNSGVVGLDPANAGLIDDVLYWNDEFCANSRLHILEQLAFGFVLGRNTHLSEAGDLVFHYWPPYLLKPFRTLLPGIMRESAAIPLVERAAHCYTYRPRPTLSRRAKVIFKRLLQSAGLLRGRTRCNEW